MVLIKNIFNIVSSLLFESYWEFLKEYPVLRMSYWLFGVSCDFSNDNFSHFVIYYNWSSKMFYFKTLPVFFFKFSNHLCHSARRNGSHSGKILIKIVCFLSICSLLTSSPLSWGCRIHQLLLCREVSPSPHTHNECPGYDIKQSNGEVPLMLELWGMQSTTWLPSLPSLLWLRVIAPDRVLSMDQIELFDI